jgi:hypothetical protein
MFFESDEKIRNLDFEETDDALRLAMGWRRPHFVSPSREKKENKSKFIRAVSGLQKRSSILSTRDERCVMTRYSNETPIFQSQWGNGMSYGKGYVVIYRR